MYIVMSLELLTILWWEIFTPKRLLILYQLRSLQQIWCAGYWYALSDWRYFYKYCRHYLKIYILYALLNEAFYSPR